MSFKQFIDGIKFNFINFFAFWVFNVCAAISMFIVLYDPSGKNVQLASIQSNNNNIILLLIGFFFGSSKSNSKKDDTISTVIANNKTLRDEAKQNSDAKDNS
jgi:hypothetical protein